MVLVPTQGVTLEGDLAVPDEPRGIVVFAHGSGSSRLSPRNRRVADALNAGRLATLLLDLLTASEATLDDATAQFRFDLTLLAPRLAAATDWVASLSRARGLPLGLSGASTGAAAALIAAAARPDTVRAVVSRGGRPDLAGPYLERVRAPTLLVVGECDVDVLQMNRDAARRLGPAAEVVVVERAGHLFEEPGALGEVIVLALHWFERHLTGSRQALEGQPEPG
jgi:dienelactone hydrolase